MSEFIDNTEKEDDNQVMKKMKIDTPEQPEQPEQPSNPFMGLSLINPDEIEENLALYKPEYNVGKKFIMNDKEYIIKYIMTDSIKGGIKKYLYKPYPDQDKLYSGSAYDIDILIDMEPLRKRKGQPIGGKHKSRRHKRRKSRKSRKSKKSKKSRK